LADLAEDLSWDGSEISLDGVGSLDEAGSARSARMAVHLLGGPRLPSA